MCMNICVGSCVWRSGGVWRSEQGCITSCNLCKDLCNISGNGSTCTEVAGSCATSMEAARESGVHLYIV